MSLFEVGRLCMKIAGRDAGKVCVVAEVINSKMVLIDGETRRRRVNVMHLEPLDKVLRIPKNAGHEQVTKELEGIGLKVRESKPKDKKPKPVKKLTAKLKTKPAKIKKGDLSKKSKDVITVEDAGTAAKTEEMKGGKP